MKHLSNYINESKSEVDKVFNKIIGKNENIKKNFIKFIDSELLSDNPIFKTRKELLDEWPTVEDAIADKTLFYELEEATEKNDFNYNAFYDVIDLIHNNHKDIQFTELVYIYLKNTLK